MTSRRRCRTGSRSPSATPSARPPGLRHPDRRPGRWMALRSVGAARSAPRPTGPCPKDHDAMLAMSPRGQAVDPGTASAVRSRAGAPSGGAGPVPPGRAIPRWQRGDFGPAHSRIQRACGEAAYSRAEARPKHGTWRGHHTPKTIRRRWCRDAINARDGGGGGGAGLYRGAGAAAEQQTIDPEDHIQTCDRSRRAGRWCHHRPSHEPS